MQRSGLRLLPLMAVLAVGCGGPVKQTARKSALAHGPRYGWLHKQGPVVPHRTAQLPPRTNKPLDGPTDGMAPQRVQASPAEPTVQASNALAILPDAPSAFGATTALAEIVPIDRAIVQEGDDYYMEEERRWNVKGIVAAPIGVATVVTGIALHNILVMIIGGAIALALGLIASRQCRDREDRGRAFALVGMILGAFSLFFGLMVLIRVLA